MRKLIITADDYGFTAGVNRGIEACVRTGSVRSVCVMPNMPYWESAACLQEMSPLVSIGIHWTVTQGAPVLPPVSIPSLVDQQGNFHLRDAFRRRAYQGKINLDELARELAAQWERLRRVVPRPVYWNTHQNVHMHPRLYWFFLRVAQRLGITVMRSHDRILMQRTGGRLLYLVTHPGFTTKSMVVSAMSATARAKGFRMPAGVVAGTEFDPGVTSVVELVRSGTWDGVAELPIHPAADIGDLAGVSTMRESRLAEYKTFSSAKVAQDLYAAGIEPANFDTIIRS